MNRILRNKGLRRMLFWGAGVIGLSWCVSPATAAEVYWQTLFAYKNVEQIAMAETCVYGLSDGALFAVDKQSEVVTKYDVQSGLHGSNIVQIFYDEEIGKLIIAYEDGKIDLLDESGIEYVSGLYTKDMVATKTINNITAHEGKAYLAMDFGIVTFHPGRSEIVDTYYIGAGAAEVRVEDIVFIGDSIYAFAPTRLYSASMRDNIVDYRVWKSEPLGRIQRDTNKGLRYTDENGDVWEVGGDEGIVRQTATGSRLTYMPQGPVENTPYDMTAYNGYLYVVPGGRWAVEFMDPGNVMVYDGAQWMNILQAEIRAQTSGYVTDFMNVAPDPKDPMHFFVTSYGTGVYEFQGTTVLNHFMPGNSTLISGAASNPARYTRTTGAIFDEKGDLWLMNSNTSTNQLQCYSANGVWTGVTIHFENREELFGTTGDLILDHRNQNHKWILLPRYAGGLVLLDDKGTLDNSDDKTIYRSELHEANGTEVNISNLPLYKCVQDPEGNIWIGMESGLVIVPHTVDFFESDLCVRLDITEENGEQPFMTSEIHAIAFDDKGRVWVGTTTLGVYVLSADWTTIEEHYTIANSPMPANRVMSLAWDETRSTMYIGTSRGIVAYSNVRSDIDTSIEDATVDELDYGSMEQWRLHYSYSEMEEIAQSSTEVYGLANGALFSVNKQDETYSFWNKSTGLNGSTILHIAYDRTTRQLIICYTDGRIDLLADDGTVTQMPDLYQKSATISVTVNDLYVGSDRTYLAMPFGIVTLNTQKVEVIDTYYIGDSACSVDVSQIAVLGDTLYAMAAEGVYTAALRDNLVDYAYWHLCALPNNREADAMEVANDRLYVLQDSVLYYRADNQWVAAGRSLRWISATDNRLFGYMEGRGVVVIGAEEVRNLGDYNVVDMQYDVANNCYWMAASGTGIIRLNGQNEVQTFRPNGPISNYGYRLRYTDGHIYVAGGSRWATEAVRPGDFSVYDGETWHGISATETLETLRSKGIWSLPMAPRDIVSIGGDPRDGSHFFAAMYGMGLLEFRDYQVVGHYNKDNSTLYPAAENNPAYYTRVEAPMVDEEGNLWVLNAGANAHPINIMTSQGQWYGLDIRPSGGSALRLETPWEITVDNRNKNYKWLIDQRSSTGVILLDDGGTPIDGSDDRSMKRNTFLDTDNIQLRPENIFCLAQDLDGDIWIGTPSGIIVIPSSVDFFTSNACMRIKIPRNDGTNLADYLLGTERINAIVVDGANRKWIGTETSGIYLMSADGLTTLAHFTTENSVLPSNTILSIAIHPQTGEVFVGTGSGIASYRSDAAEAHDDLEEVYAFPNPVRPHYQGVITITGLMENTTVNIIDAGGNLVCKTRSNGGIAVWDGKNFRGERVGSGVYTALCNAEGKNHTAVKILVMN